MKHIVLLLTGASLCIAGGWGLSQQRSTGPMHIEFAATPLPHSVDAASPDLRPAEAPLFVVDVEGHVRKPGLHRLHPGARVADAIEIAGGGTGDADLAAIDRAELLEDGKEIVVPSHASAESEPFGVVDSETPHRKRKAAHAKHHRRYHGRATATPPPEGVNVSEDLNTASAADLAKVPGIDPVLASRIVYLRSIDGRFDALDDLLDVAGMNDARLRRVVPYIHVAT